VADDARIVDSECVEKRDDALGMPSNGHVSAGGTITLSCAAGGGTAVARVADTGPGIPAGQLESIFEPFVQLTSGLTDRGGGVGLGLPISRDLARAMKGDVQLERTASAGSCFTLALPRARLTSSPQTPVVDRAEARA
jgi:signal transduction histidine kinase